MDRIKHRKDFAKGTFVAGPSGRRYFVNPDTSELHLVSRKGGNVSDTPGVLAEDAEEFSQFGRMFRRVSVSPPAPPKKKKAAPPPPAKKATGEPEESQASEGGDKESPDRSEKASSLADSLPNDNNSLTIKEWLDMARGMGIALSKREKGTRPKSKLIALIRDKAKDLPPKAPAK